MPISQTRQWRQAGEATYLAQDRVPPERLAADTRAPDRHATCPAVPLLGFTRGMRVFSA